MAALELASLCFFIGENIMGRTLNEFVTVSSWPMLDHCEGKKVNSFSIHIKVNWLPIGGEPWLL